MFMLLYAYLQFHQLHFDICESSYRNVSYVYIDETGLIVWGPKNDSFMYQFDGVDACSTSSFTETPNNAVATQRSSSWTEYNFTEPKTENLAYHCPETSNIWSYVSPLIGVLSFIIGLIIKPDVISKKLNMVFKSSMYSRVTRSTTRETDI